MLNKCSESDFYELRMVAESRLRPDAIVAWFIAVFLYSGIILLFHVNGTSNNRNIDSYFWDVFVNIAEWSLLLQLLIILFFLRVKNAFKFQRIQSILFSITGLKMSIEMYSVYFFICDDRGYPNYTLSVGLYALLGGLIGLIIFTIRGVMRVKNGHFKSGGLGLYHFKNKWIFAWFPVIFSFTIILGRVAPIFLNLSDDKYMFVGMLVPLFLVVLIQYVMALALPEFFLLTYCKFKFSAFRVSYPKQLLRKHTKKVKNK
jgi:hypothetical protein